VLAREGPQPAVDVRSIGLVGSGKCVAEGMNMLGEVAGARHPERSEVYLDNLGRLGLTVIATEPLEDQIAYQVLEAQPEVLAAVKRAGRARTVQRSVKLTPFGQDFCEVFLPPGQREPGSAQSPRPG
jgi:Abortive infection alpha